MLLRFAGLALASASLSLAVAPERDFSGKWIIATGDRLSVPFEDTLSIEQNETEIRCSSGSGQWSYALNGTERKAQIGGESRNSLVKWEGAALLINTIVSGSRDYVIMDRWRLSADRASLTVTRQIIRGVRQEEGRMVYRRDNQAAAPPPRPVTEEPRELPPPPPRPAPILRPDPEPVRRQPAPPPPLTPPPALVRRQDPAPFEVVIAAGTHIPLTFRNTVDTKHSHEGDRIYLQTAFPVARDGRIIIPRGSFVNGVITAVKQPGRTAKGELSIRFDTLTLPNGVTRDFRSRPAGGDEGKITGEPGRGADPRNVGQAAGTGATVGVMTGAAAGHAGLGAGIGGAAAGIASVLFSHGVNTTLPQGTAVDMVLDRDLRFQSAELQ